MKTLQQIVNQKSKDKVQSTFPIEPDSTTALVPRSKDEKRFYDKHIVDVKADVNGNGDEVFKASNIKAYDRSTSHHGYNTKQDQEVYEGVSLRQILGEKRTLTSDVREKRHEIAMAIKRENPGMDKSKVMAIATDRAFSAVKNEEVDLTESEISGAHYDKHFNAAKSMLDSIADAMDQHSSIASQGGETTPMWHHVEHIKNLHQQLSNMHDDLMRTVDYSQPPTPVQVKESFEDLLGVFDDETADAVKHVYDNVDDESKALLKELIVNEDYEAIQNIFDEIAKD